MKREEAIKKLRQMSLPKETMEILEAIAPELREIEDESLKNKSGYYKGGKFWKASTLWQAVKNKIPQRVPNRYILQDCTWNISSLRAFADEVKNVQEAELDYPIILDINGNILDGAHRVVKAYLQNKDIDVVYLGDDEWPEPDYDEEKAVKESEDERIRKGIIRFLESEQAEGIFTYEARQSWLAWLEKQKEQKPADEQFPPLEGLDAIKAKYYDDGFKNGFDEGVESVKPAEWSEEDEQRYFSCLQRLGTGNPTQPETINSKWFKEHVSFRPSWKPSDEQMEALNCAIADVARFSKRNGRQVEFENEPYYAALHSLSNDLKKLSHEIH